jgi:hypothetical protein
MDVELGMDTPDPQTWCNGFVEGIAVLAIYEFWSSYDQNPNPIRASISPGWNDPEMNSPRLALLDLLDKDRNSPMGRTPEPFADLKMMEDCE